MREEGRGKMDDVRWMMEDGRGKREDVQILRGNINQRQNDSEKCRNFAMSKTRGDGGQRGKHPMFAAETSDHTEGNIRPFQIGDKLNK